MVNISPLQQQWQHELSLVQQDEADGFNKNQEYIEKLAALDDRLNNMRGLSRVKKPFIRATKIAWLHHKQKKMARHLAKEERQLSNTAANTFSTLGETIAGDSAYATDFYRLKNAIARIRDTQSTVDHAASQCSIARMMETAAAASEAANQNNNGVNNGINIGAGINAATAAFAVSNAEAAVRDLQRDLQQAMPQLNGGMANNISMSNSWALMMGMFNGMMGVFADLNVATQLGIAESHMNDISSQLSSAINNFVREKNTIVKTAMTEARQSDADLEKFAGILENYMLPAAMRKSTELKKKNTGLIKK